MPNEILMYWKSIFPNGYLSILALKRICSLLGKLKSEYLSCWGNCQWAAGSERLFSGNANDNAHGETHTYTQVMTG